MSTLEPNQTLMSLRKFLEESSKKKSGKYKTINLDADLHLFYKQTANHYDLALSELMFNILDQWKEEHQQEIKEDILKNLNS